MADPKKYLLITYYWPPAGGGGVQRWLKMTKYLPNHGWTPVVYTPENGELPVRDDSLLAEVPESLEVVKTPIWEPYSWYKKFTGRKASEKIYSGFINEGKQASFTQKLSVFIRGNFFIPDARRFWINPSIRFLKQYLQEHPVDAIISTGPPHSMHLIALALQQHFGIPWIADFRDPWTQIDFYEQLRLTRWADRRHHALEKKVLQTADRVVTVGWRIAEQLGRIRGKQDVAVILNGYDLVDFADLPPYTPSGKFRIAHIGSMNADRNPEVLWEVLSELSEQHEAFRNALEIFLAGQVDHAVLRSLEQRGLTAQVTRIPFIPHQEVPTALRHSDLLLLVINNTPSAKGILTGKLFEYFGAQRPVLAIGPKDSDIGRLLQQTPAGQLFDYRENHALKTHLTSTFRLWQQGALTVPAQETRQYSRQALSGDFAALLDELV